MIRSSMVSSCPLISGTISFLVGSMRQADELSITIVPASAYFGAHSKEVPPPAEKIAISAASLQPSSILLMVYSLSLNFIFAQQTLLRQLNRAHQMQNFFPQVL